MTIYGKATVVKIVVLPMEGSNPETYSIQVVDGSRVIRTEKAEGLAERDRIVWWLADLYDTPDIELKPHDKKQVDPEFKFSEIPSIPVLQESDADEFFESNQAMVFDRIVQAVAEGISTNRPFIRLFELSGTGVYLTSHKDSWKSGLQQALQYFVKAEVYEKCSLVKKLMAKL